MGRIRKNIQVEEMNFWTLFDTGARNTYVIPKIAELMQTKDTEPLTFNIGGEKKVSRQTCLLQASIGGHYVDTTARVINKIGIDEEGKDIEILFGALAMQNWSIRPVPDTEELDFSHYPTEFVEF